MSIFIIFLKCLQHIVQQFPDSAPNRQFLWAVKAKILTAHQSLREPQMKFWAVGPPIWPPCSKVVGDVGLVGCALFAGDNTSKLANRENTFHQGRDVRKNYFRSSHHLGNILTDMNENSLFVSS